MKLKTVSVGASVSAITMAMSLPAIATTSALAANNVQSPRIPGKSNNNYLQVHHINVNPRYDQAEDFSGLGLTVSRSFTANWYGSITYENISNVVEIEESYSLGKINSVIDSDISLLVASLGYQYKVHEKVDFISAIHRLKYNGTYNQQSTFSASDVSQNNETSVFSFKQQDYDWHLEAGARYWFTPKAYTEASLVWLDETQTFAHELSVSYQPTESIAIDFSYQRSDETVELRTGLKFYYD